MTQAIIVNYKKRSRDNLKTALLRQRYAKAITDAINDHKGDSVILLETPPENYLDVNLASVQSLIKNGFEGVYLSFQRPFNNISKLFEQEEIDINKLLVIDGATAITGGIIDENSRCVGIPMDFEINNIIKTICSSLPRLNSKNRFVYVDSLTTMALYESRPKAFSLPEYLANSIRKNRIENVVLLFNIAEDIIQEKYIDRLSFYSDEHIHLGLCT